MQDDVQAVVSGTVDMIIYQNEENGYTVCGIDTEDGDSLVLVGTIPFLTEGDRITAYGAYTNHATYGRQFKVASYEKHLPTETADILKYLASGAVRGIGPKTAARIVNQFGSDTFDVIEHHPSWLAEIHGISAKNAEAIHDRFLEVAGARQVMMFCRSYFSTATAMRIYKKWGGSAVDRIREDPYALCHEFYGISFARADQIAESVGLPPDDLHRVDGGLLYILTSEAQRNGHTCLPAAELIAAATELLGDGVSREVIKERIVELVATGALRHRDADGKTYLYKKSYFDAERYVARKMKLLASLCPRIDVEDARRLILQVENASGITYAALQRQAILTALASGIMVLTGGPGTGKTTVIKGLLSIFGSLDMDVALAAPTGRAAKRMSEATSSEASTLHRLLEMEHNDDTEPKFARNEHNLLDENVFIIDEASMIDVSLMHAFLKAVRPGARIILIGDTEQLPSVGAGNLLGDVIASGCFPTVRLTEVFRQSAESLIVMNAHAIQRGECPVLDAKDRDFFFLPRQTDEDVARTVVSLCQTRLPKTYGRDVLQQLQIITPSHKGAAGTDTLNELLQSALNPASPQKAEKASHGIVFREGDRVMQVRNNYDLEWDKDGQTGLGIFNGDVGVIREVDYAGEMLTICFDDRLVAYDFAALDDLELAYAITVHKSQGCEYPIVIIPVFGCAPMLQTRNLLYTAITRAGRMVILVGREDILRHMVDNDRHAWRCTGLEAFLREEDDR